MFMLCITKIRVLPEKQSEIMVNNPLEIVTGKK